MANGKKVAGVNVDMTLELAQFKQSCRDAENVTKQMTAQMREEMGKSRESVRLLSEELHLGIPRGLQSIIAYAPGVATAMNLAFSSVVVFALINTLIEVTKKVEEFAHKNEEAAKKHEEAWGSIHDSMRATNTEIELTTLKLENVNRKLEHKPQTNGPQIAILEAKKAAEELEKQLGTDIKLIEGALQKTDVGLISSIFEQKARNPYEQTMVEQHRIHMRDAETPEDMLNEANSFGISLTTRGNELAALSTGKHSYLDGYGKTQNIDTKHANYGVDYSGEINDTKDMQASSRDEITLVKDTQQRTAAQVQNVTDVKTDENAKAAKTAAEAWMKALEASFKAGDVPAPGSITGRASLEQWNSGKDQREYDALSGATPASGAAKTLLTAKLDELTAGLKNAAIALGASEYDKTTEAMKAWIAKEDEDARKAVETAEKVIAANEKLAEVTAKGAEEAASMLAKQQVFAAHTGVETHTMSPHSAALQVAAANAAEFAAKIAAANEVLDKLIADSTRLTRGSSAGIDNAAKQQGIRNQIAGFQGDAGLSAQEGALAVYKTTMSSALDEWIFKATDLKSIMGGLFTESINHVNDAILKLLTTKNDPHPFRAAGHAIFTDAAKKGLEGAEGEFMKAGKLGASEANAMWVRMTSVKSTGSGGLLPPLMLPPTLPPSLGSVFSSPGGGTPNPITGIISDILPFLGLAGGGVMSPGDFYMTGEQGPELLQVGSTSKINNARDTSAIMAGSGGNVTNHSWNIDARGATDPAATRMQVQRGIVDAVPHIAAATIGLQKDQRARRSSRSN
ncbi:MAG: hypothetical protein ABSF28_07865 [Terracidiphilus sp.]|jgi:hypothetical protein